MVRIFYIHGVNSRSELSHMFEGAPGSGADQDRIKSEYDSRMRAMEKKVSAAALAAGFERAEFVPVYWGDLGSRIRHYRRVEDAPSEKLIYEPQVQATVEQPKIAFSPSRERTQGSGWARSEADEDMLFELEAIAARMDAAAPSLRDVVLAEPHAALAALFSHEPERSGSGDTPTDARIPALAKRITLDQALRASLQAIDPTAADADQHLVRRLTEELDRNSAERRQGNRRGPMRWLGAVVSWAAIPWVKSSRMYAQSSRTMGDALIYFLQRGTRERPGPIVERVRDTMRGELPREPDGVPNVVITHSLGCTIFYDLFTFFDPGIRFDLWISVGSQLSLYEEIKILASSRQGDPSPETPGRPQPTPVALPAGAVWYNFFDPRDPLAYASAGLFQHVRDVMRRCSNAQLDEIHNAHLEEGALYDALAEWLAELPAATRKPA